MWFCCSKTVQYFYASVRMHQRHTVIDLSVCLSVCLSVSQSVSQSVILSDGRKSRGSLETKR